MTLKSSKLASEAVEVAVDVADEADTEDTMDSEVLLPEVLARPLKREYSAQWSLEHY